MEQSLFHNKGDGTFEERALEAGVALSDDGKTYCRAWAWRLPTTITTAFPTSLVTNLALEKYALYRNEGGGQFSLRQPDYRTGRIDGSQLRVGRRLCRFR